MNWVSPSWADTPLTRSVTDRTPGLEGRIVEGVPMGRLATADEIADVALFLCSPMSSYMTGCGLVADGGMSLFFGGR